MIAVDTSALVAVYMREPGWEAVLEALASAAERRVAAPTLLELVIVLGRLAAPKPQHAVQALVDALGLDIVAFGPMDLALAAAAWERFGKGRHPAKLNFGDCFAYALAQRLDCPLLFVGEDFRSTDVRMALG